MTHPDTLRPEAVILPGSYDPVTVGHLALLERAAATYREVYAVIFRNPDKQYTFPLEDRIKLLLIATEALPNVLVSSSDGLVVDYMREHGIRRIIRGYRNEEDLRYETAMAEWNRTHSAGYETELWPCEPTLRAVSSSEARRRLKSGEATDGILPPAVAEFLKNR